MLLHTLLQRYNPSLNISSLPNPEILGVKEDSRQVHRGDLFVVRSAVESARLAHANEAANRGASAVVTPTKISGLKLPQVVLDDRGAASALANIYHGNPSTRLRVFGVTGTNGKTTVTYLIRHLLGKVGQRCGLVGTVEIDDGRAKREALMTTPGPVEIADLLATMRDKGCRAAAIETSSHALDQGRVAGVHFCAAGFTNLSGDHLDYHKSMENYAAAKAQLFEMLDQEALAVVNADDRWSARMVQNCNARVIRFGMGRDADYRARDIAVTASGSSFVLTTPDGKAEVHMRLIGKHNIENALCAAALVGESAGLSVHQIASGLRDAEGAPGRLQAVRSGQPFAVLVDYAHTDDALENVLSALRPLTRGRLRVLFGCGGDRDRTKRPRMARTAERLADALYITSDNPRSEDPNKIIDQILTGISKDTDKQVVVEPDRRAAIERILSDAAAEDVVLIAGKGHENYQIIGDTRHHFDDVEEADRILRSRVAV